MNNVKSIIDRISKNITKCDEKNNLNLEAKYNNIRNSYREIINNISYKNLELYKNKINNIVENCIDILENQSKNIEIIYILCILLTIIYGSYGMKIGLQSIFIIIKDFDIDLYDEDLILKRSNTINHLFGKLSFAFKEFIEIEKDFNLVKLIKSKTITSNPNTYYIIRDIKSSIDLINSIEAFIRNQIDNCAHISENVANDSIVLTSEIINEMNTIISFMTNQNNVKQENDEIYVNEDMNVEQIKTLCKYLAKSKHYNLLAKCLIYIINQIGVNTLDATRNIQKNIVIKNLVDKVLGEIK